MKTIRIIFDGDGMKAFEGDKELAVRHWDVTERASVEGLREIEIIAKMRSTEFQTSGAVVETEVTPGFILAQPGMPEDR